MVPLSDIDRRERFIANRTTNIVESVIREMTRLALQHNAINLAQGFPDFPAPAVLKKPRADAIAADINQYAITWGAKPFRDAIAAKYRRTYGLDFDPEREITVCCGATEGMIASLLAVTESRRRSRHLRAVLRKLRPRHAALRRDPQVRQAARARLDLRSATSCAARFRPRTKAIILNSPNNPTGQGVRPRASSSSSRDLCQEFDALAITDEIYEHILYDGAEHIPMMPLPGMRDRTILVNSMSKTYSVTGGAWVGCWRART